MTGSLQVNALVLRKTDYRDYDRMVTLLTPEKGLVEAVARGCRRPKSELMNAAEPFVCGKYQLFLTHERYTITQCSLTDGFYKLREDYDRLSEGARWLRLLAKVAVPEQPAEGLFQTALTALTYLTHSDIDIELLGAMFDMKLSFFSGFAPLMDRCVSCGRSAESVPLGFSAKRGGCVCENCQKTIKPLSEGARRILLKAPRTPYKAVEKLVGHPDVKEAAARIREVIEYNTEESV